MTGKVLNLYTIACDFERYGWLLLSDEYKNLDTQLQIKCPNGHKHVQTYRAWRKTHSCPICEQIDCNNSSFNKTPPPHEDGVYRILALDAATKMTGYSVYDGRTLVAYGTFKTSDSDATERINEVKLWLREKVIEWEVDFVSIENIQLQTYGHNAGPQVELYRVLANLQGVLMDECYELKKPNTLVYSSVWRKHCGITGQSRMEKKQQAQSKVYELYHLKCTDDEADAICLGKYTAEYYMKEYSGWGEE